VQELYGLIFAYMGPPDRMPVFPHFDIIEDGEGELVADDTSIGLGGPVIAECNWLQHYENVMDPFHVMVLHSRFSGEQFSPAMAVRPWLRGRTEGSSPLPGGSEFNAAGCMDLNRRTRIPSR